MKERPILFNGGMVRATLGGIKGQTRRVIDWKKIFKQTGYTRGRLAYSTFMDSWGIFDGNGGIDLCLVDCPYGKVGDQLWVRESINREKVDGEWSDFSSYKADGEITLADAWVWKNNYLPSIHCPRGLSRIQLEITGVRVEALQKISEQDAINEGIERIENFEEGVFWRDYNYDTYPQSGTLCPHVSFMSLWDSINADRKDKQGKRLKYAWKDNPFVWVIEFKRIES